MYPSMSMNPAHAPVKILTARGLVEATSALTLLQLYYGLEELEARAVIEERERRSRGDYSGPDKASR